MSKSPKISIITVTYNCSKTIEQTILSVINQTYDNIEYIIIDGGSDDGTIDIIKKYENKITRWISEPDKGIYDAMNKGAKVTTGDWVYFLGGHNILNDCLHEFVPTFQRETIYYGDVFMTVGKYLHHWKFNSYALGRGNVSHQAIFYPKSVFTKYEYDLKYKAYADWLLNIICSSDKSYKAKFINHVIAQYKDDGFSAINPDELFKKNHHNLIKSHCKTHVYLFVITRSKLSQMKRYLLK